MTDDIAPDNHSEAATVRAVVGRTPAGWGAE
jgi:hypothetical protein